MRHRHRSSVISEPRPWNHRWASRRSERGGLLLLWGLSFGMVLFLLALSYFLSFQSTVMTTGRTFRLEQALALADAGLEHALWEIKTNNGANLTAGPPTGGWSDPGATACDDEIDGGTDGLLYGTTVTSCRQLTQVLDAQDPVGSIELGTYRVWVVNYATNLVRIVARGFVPNATSLQATQTVTLDLEKPDATVGGAILANVQLRSTGPAYVDSYISSLAPYDPLTARDNGDIISYGRNAPSAPDIQINDLLTQVHGRAVIPPGGTAQIVPPGQPTKGIVSTAPSVLPRVQIPTSLTTLSVTNTIAGFPGSQTSDGHFFLTGTYTCNAPLRIRSLQVAGGTLNIGDSCQLFVDGTGASAIPMGWGVGLDVNSGQILKTGIGTTQIFVRDVGLDLDGHGLSYASSITAANQHAKNLQLYVTCAAQSCAPWNHLAQDKPFVGMIYTEGGQPLVAMASSGGFLYDSNYYGAFISGGELYIQASSSTTTNIHYDEDLANLALDGSGLFGTTTYRYQIRAGSWNVR